ncbi:putative ribosomal protein L28 [Paratrimastix pyriformis]|uniref:Ribosomal protein L28 n=1 Tax=Paratrimastix pyriformis TaxID=342808 RepID=A0ABQ8UG46_9EUKA|nr:putative ribosomal protein L28 [Paratrimastix pyriformis]
MSADLTWMILRDGHSFLIERDGVRFSAEPGNVMNKHSYKYSGFANKKTVDVAMGDKKKHTVAFAMKKQGCSIRKPAQMLQKSNLKFSAKLAKVIAYECAGKHYRADLSHDAIRRAKKILRTLKVEKKDKQ